LSRHRTAEAEPVLVRMGGREYAHAMVRSIAAHLQQARAHPTGWRELASPGVRRLAFIGTGLAVLQQWSGINILFNYAEEVYRSAGYGVNQIMLDIVITGTINLLFTLVAMTIVDRWGRRPLMLAGCAGIGISHLLAG